MTVLSAACTGSAAPGKEPETRWERTGYYIKEKYMRLDKFLADMNQGTRKELKQLIRKGLVTVDGVTVKDPGTAVTKTSDIVLAEIPVVYNEYEYYMMNKPRGVITATEDARQETVLDLMAGEHRKDISPVGRLDKDTVGLLLITNDGQLNHQLLSPKHHVDKEYLARVSGKVTENDVKAFARGLFIEEGFRALPAQLKIQAYREIPAEADFRDLAMSNAPGQDLPDGVTEITVVIQEGKYHQIKKMFHAIGKEVIYLQRIRMGSLELDPNLQEGQYRKLTDEEIRLLKQSRE